MRQGIEIKVLETFKVGRGYLEYLFESCNTMREVVEQLKTSPLLVPGLNQRNRAITMASMLFMLEEKRQVLPLMVEIMEGKDFCVSAMPEGKDDFSSYVEVLVTEKDKPLYDFFLQQVGTLNVAGINEEIPNIGEKYDDTIYALFVDKSVHEQIIAGKEAGKE